jgi:Zn-dependent M16 (insulinase) family peptidase
MNNFTDSNNPDILKDSNIYGYMVNKVLELEGKNAFFYEFEHIDTGAKHIHISNDDKENTFAVAFKTVPTDSTGVAHILEHTVLCGSKKFQVRDPFFSMLKRSLSTFMNAFTASDWTMYPFSTQNKKDFYNLADVYLDSAFFPRIDELSFKQEGYRIEIDDCSDPSLKPQTSSALVYKGVVYNEMKGAMSSPDQVMARSLLNALYPDTTYKNNSGGDPAKIPDLTYDQLKAFHARHYHPSNAFFYTYGNLPVKDHLVYISEKILTKFKKIDPKTVVPSQPRWQSPKAFTYYYPMAANEPDEKKSQACVAWLLADIKDAFEVFALTILEQILLGNSASPLRKALIDSGLGTAMCDGTGLDCDNKDTMFVAGLKDIQVSDTSKIESIISDVLLRLVAEGIDPEIIESAIHQIEFSRKEVTNSPYPYGLKLLLSFSGAWFHGGDPEKNIQIDDHLKQIRAKMLQKPFFENLIEKYFLNNSHKAVFTLAPDKMMAKKEQKRVEEQLAEIKKHLKPQALEKIICDAEKLKQRQEQKENVSCLPTLALEDIPPSVHMIKQTDGFAHVPGIFYNQPTAGIFYVSLAAGAGILDTRLLKLVPFFCRAFSKVGTAVHDYAKMAQRIDRYTGGIGLGAAARTGFDETGACIPYVSFSGKCLERNQSKMFEIIDELLCQITFSDQVRLKNVLLEYRAGLESMIVHNGHVLAISLASRKISDTCALSELWSGVHQLKTIKKLTDNLTDDKLKTLSDDLLLIAKKIFTRNNIRLAMIGEERVLPDAAVFSESIHSALAKNQDSADVFYNNPGALDAFCDAPADRFFQEGWSASTAVSFVAKSFQTVRLGHKDAPAIAVIGKMLRSLYLHREIREKGGAYGGFSIYNSEDGLFSFGSYRDPHIVATLKAYKGASDFIKTGNYTEEDIKEAILQICSDIDKPDPPGPSARKAFARKIAFLTDDMRMDFKKNLLEITRNKVMTAAEKYFSDDNRCSVAVISNEEKLKEANGKLPGHQLKLNRI